MKTNNIPIELTVVQLARAYNLQSTRMKSLYFFIIIFSVIFSFGCTNINKSAPTAVQNIRTTESAKNEPSQKSQIPQIHYFANESISLEDITINVVFFVPKNSINYKNVEQSRALIQSKFNEYKDFFANTGFAQIEQFHAREFNEQSRIHFSFHPEIIYGLYDAEFYEQDFSSLEEHEPLKKIEDELMHRSIITIDKKCTRSCSMFLILYYNSPIKFGSQLILGLSNDTGFASLIFSPVLDYLFFDSIIYHELMHAMGVPEYYDTKNDKAIEQDGVRDDVMGQGIVKELHKTYLGNDIKVRMGFNE